MKTKEQIEAKLKEIEGRLERGRAQRYGMDRDDEGECMSAVVVLSWVLDVESSEGSWGNLFQ